MANAQRTRKYISIRMLGMCLAIIILVGGCIGGFVLNTLFLTLPSDGEQALIERVYVDHCGGLQCDEIQMYNLSRMGGEFWCVNLQVYSKLYDAPHLSNPIAETYKMRRIGDGVWEMEDIPGSICDTWSLSGRRYILDKNTGDAE